MQILQSRLRSLSYDKPKQPGKPKTLVLRRLSLPQQDS